MNLAEKVGAKAADVLTQMLTEVVDEALGAIERHAYQTFMAELAHRGVRVLPGYHPSENLYAGRGTDGVLWISGGYGVEAFAAGLGVDLLAEDLLRTVIERQAAIVAERYIELIADSDPTEPDALEW